MLTINLVFILKKVLTIVLISFLIETWTEPLSVKKRCYCRISWIVVFLWHCVKWRCPQWTRDEKICARNVNNEIHFYEDNNFGKVFFAVIDCRQMHHHHNHCHCHYSHHYHTTNYWRMPTTNCSPTFAETLFTTSAVFSQQHQWHHNIMVSGKWSILCNFPRELVILQTLTLSLGWSTKTCID